MSEVFNIQHEVDLSEYDSTVTDGGDLSQSGAAALGGSSGGLSCLIDDTTVIYGHKDFTQLTSSSYRFRFYIDPNELTMVNGDDFYVMYLYDSGSARARVELRYESSNYTILARVRDDSNNWQDSATPVITDAEHYIEVLVEYASGASAEDGVLTLWVDGVQESTRSDIDLYSSTKPDEARLGAVVSIDAGIEGTFYLDEFILRDDSTEIGPTSVPVTVTPSVLTTTWATKAPSIAVGMTVFPSVLPTTWAVKAPAVAVVVSPSVLAVTWAIQAPTIRGAAIISPSVLAVTWAIQAPTIRGAATVSPSVLAATWALQTPSAGNVLYIRQMTLSGIPTLTLDIGGHDLSAYVVGYLYEEVAQELGGLAIWLDNRDGNFDDLATDWPSLIRGAAVDLRRGLVVDGTAMVEKLPRVWVDSLQYVYDAGAAMLLLVCVDWWGKLEAFRYATKQELSATEIQTMVTSLLAEVSLTLESGSFGFAIDHEIDVTEDGDEAVRDLMDKVEEFLYVGLDGEVRFKALDTAETAGYNYDWSSGGGSTHPLLAGSEIAESSAEYNKVTVTANDGAYSGTAQSASEIALVGTRQYTTTDDSLTSNAQCLERAEGELSFWLARMVAGTLVARPHFTLQLYDVVSIAAPPWGGPALPAARVTGITERYGWGDWEQELRVGDLPEQSLLYASSRPGRRRSSSSRKSRRYYSSGSSSYAKKNHTHDADDMVDGAVGTDQLADGAVTTPKIADDAVTGAKIASGAVDTSQLASDAVTNAKIANNAVDSAQIATGAVDSAEIATGAVGQTEIASNAVGNSEMRDNAIDTAELADGAVTSVKIADGTISNVDLASGIVDTAELVDDAVTAAKLAADSVNISHIQSGAVGYWELTAALRTLLGI